MKRLFFLACATVFLVAPLAVNAGTAKPYARYCSDPKEIFTGVAQNTDNSPKIELTLDPDFEKDELRGKRKISGEISVTPVYDLVVTIVPTINEYCLPQYDDDGTMIQKVDPPTTLPFQLFIEDAFVYQQWTIPAVRPYVDEGSWILVGPSTARWNGRWNESGQPVYEWKIPGWTHGITATEVKLKALINSVTSGTPLLVVANRTKKDGAVERTEKQISFNLCVPIWGSGNHRLIGTYAGTGGSDIIPLSERVQHFDKVREEGFQRINPMALPQYKIFFSYFVDLKPVVGTELNPFEAIMARRLKDRDPEHPLPYTLDLHNKSLLSIIGNSSCGDTGMIFTTINKSFGNGIAMQNDSAGRMGTVIGGSQPPRTYVHEWGHTFAGLNDEYTYDPDYQGKRVTNVPLFLTNCALNPYTSYKYNNRLYDAVQYKGCSYDYIISGVAANASELDSFGRPYATLPPGSKIDELQYFYRPAFASIMGGPVKVEKRPEMFNVVSCGWILAAIKGGDPKSYFPECAAMSGVIKEGVQAAGAFERLFALLRDPLSRLSILEKGGEGSGALVAAARAAQFKSGTQVIVRGAEARVPPVEFEAVLQGVKKEKPEQCLDASGRRVFAENPAPMREGWAKEARCAQGLAEATLLMQKIEDLKESVAVLERFLNSMTLSEREARDMRTLDKTAFVLFPSGVEEESIYHHIGAVALACITDPQNRVKSEQAPIGVSGTVKEKMYTESTSELAQAAAKTKLDIGETHKVFQGESAGSRGKVTNNTIGRLKTLKTMLNGNFVLVTETAFKRFHTSPEVGKDAISLSVAFERGADGKTQACAVQDRWASAQIGIGGLGEFTRSTVTFGNQVFAGDCVPSSYLLGELLVGIAKNREFYEKKKAEYERLLKEAEAQLKNFEAVSYNCPRGGGATEVTTAAPNAVGNRIVRKSTVTPESRRAADAGSGQEAQATGGAADPSYLIVESFDSDDPWGEIWGIAGSAFATTTATTTSFGVATTTPRTSTTTPLSATTTPHVVTTTATFAATTTSTGEGGVGARATTTARTATTTVNATATSTATSIPSFLSRAVTAVTDAVGNIISRITRKSEMPARETSGESVAEPQRDAHIGVNLIPSPFQVENGTGAGSGVYMEGPLSLRGTIERTGDTVAGAFKSVIKFASPGGELSDLATAEVPILNPGASADMTYSFEAKRGMWRFVFCVDTDNLVVETNETDNCSPPLAIEVRGSGALPEAPARGEARLSLSVPQWSGTSAGAGRLRAGDMQLSVKVSNIGEGYSEPVKGLWQYAVATGPFNDWVEVEFPPVEPEGSVSSLYSWKGGTGLWRARFCVRSTKAPEGLFCSGAVAVDIIE
jgi:hypothetical protein